MVLVIDFGNTQVKTAVFERDSLIEKSVISYNDWFAAIEMILQKFQKITNIAVASVKSDTIIDFSQIAKIRNCVFINRECKFPFNNLYKTPETLGIDRMVLAAGAVFKYPKKNRLVIDAGTCITYDFIDENDNYLGGAISPGLQLRYKSLHQHTSKLPMLSLQMPKTTIGNATTEAIHSGIVNGVVHEINGFIKSFEKNNANFIIILTGGDTIFLANQLKNTIFANSNFLLESLNQTFQYNQK